MEVCDEFEGGFKQW